MRVGVREKKTGFRYIVHKTALEDVVMLSESVTCLFVKSGHDTLPPACVEELLHCARWYCER